MREQEFIPQTSPAVVRTGPRFFLRDAAGGEAWTNKNNTPFPLRQW